MSVTVSGGMLHVPEWSVRVDRILDMSDREGRLRLVVSSTSGVGAITMETAATRAEIIAALALWDQNQRVLAVYGSRNLLEGKYNV